MSGPVSAALGQAIAEATHELRAKDLESAIGRYVARGAPADHAHRHLEQRRDRRGDVASRGRSALGGQNDARATLREWSRRHGKPAHVAVELAKVREELERLQKQTE